MMERLLTPRPLGLIAELTYRCPLRCPYCSNPTEYPPAAGELTTAEWQRVLAEAGRMGLAHALFTGGEPLLRADLEELVASARGAGLYTNLITSAVGLTERRARALKTAGLDSVQISFQSDAPELADSIAGTTAHGKKLAAATLVREHGWPLTINVVLHRSNIGRLPGIIRLAEELGAIRLELASTQFYGWAFRNRDLLLPTREQVAAAEAAIAQLKSQTAREMQIVYVVPDYYADRPKPCMSGWGHRYLVVNPNGDVLPCGAATVIPDLRFDNVRDRELSSIWCDSESFNRFRGTDWMEEPCRSCDRREIDFGGCRCQAALLTGSATRTDPSCALAPERERLTRLVSGDRLLPLGAGLRPEHYRRNPPGGSAAQHAEESTSRR
jgi:pyrroloquinoline quinone biosynthesis protein E